MLKKKILKMVLVGASRVGGLGGSVGWGVVGKVGWGRCLVQYRGQAWFGEGERGEI